MGKTEAEERRMNQMRGTKVTGTRWHQYRETIIFNAMHNADAPLKAAAHWFILAENATASRNGSVSGVASQYVTIGGILP